ncbi:putative bifunctional diguanylate cyclase/phosphodiesterase [Mobilicoccus caccae]|uniref:putative bifunctional diguanylate cyclase/phosphodiesterase n=1 Tax=Mobilicoccus caccae TaxID=1859295 RepID=UPI0024E14A8A|nr:bifunctional diguanylate cyclase/phosphodiesterase [Mobilicoccus caccae]
MLDALEDRLIRDAVTGRFTVVLFLDCNDFKRVNDTWGHHAGDTVLRDIATRLPAVLHPREIVARHGGDEFVVVSSTEDTAGAVSLAERVRSAFDAPLRIIPGRVHAMTPAMGLALAGPDDRCTTEELLGRADAAMYESKQRGCGGHVVFDDALALRLRTRAEVGDRLEQVTCTDPFDIVLQPIMGGPEHRTLIGREALARWRDPQLGDVPPDVFVPVAEQLGLITTLGEAVLRRACREAAGLRATGEEDEVDLFVNVSPAQLRDPGFAGVVRDALATTGLPPARLRLEVTETELVDEGPATAETLEALREAGIRLCVDDFGTGYASLATLLRLPVDCVKLDRSLVAGLGESEAAERQLAAVMSLVRSLGIEDIVAEGVETEQQAIALLELGCPLAQGWFYGRPCPSTDALVGRHLLERRAARRDAGGPATAAPP